MENPRRTIKEKILTQKIAMSANFIGYHVQKYKTDDKEINYKIIIISLLLNIEI